MGKASKQHFPLVSTSVSASRFLFRPLSVVDYEEYNQINLSFHWVTSGHGIVTGTETKLGHLFHSRSFSISKRHTYVFDIKSLFCLKLL